MKDYKILKCPHCSAKCYDKHSRKFDTVGASVFECPACGRKSYRQNVLEPAMLSYSHFFNLRFSEFYFAVRILIVLVYVALAVYVFLEKDSYTAVYCVLVALLIYVVYEFIRFIHKMAYKKSQEYRSYCYESLNRLAYSGYSELILMDQQPEEGCPYLAEENKEQ